MKIPNGYLAEGAWKCPTCGRLYKTEHSYELHFANDDYKERFKAEYWQIVIRCRKLVIVLSRCCKQDHITSNGFAQMLFVQLQRMYDLILIYEQRADVESIDLMCDSKSSETTKE